VNLKPMPANSRPKTPLIDVLVPAYNAESTIRTSIESIQSQTLTDLRLIVVNDGSTDKTARLLENMSKGDDRIVVHTQENKGIVDALNACLCLSTAPFIARHDADDIAYPRRLERQLEYLKAHSDCVAVGANAWHIGEHDQWLGTRTVFFGDVDPDPYAVPSREPYLIHPFLMVRREAMLAAGGYRYCFHAEDVDLYWRLLRFGRLHNLEDVLGEYRVHEGSVSSASIRNGRIAAKFSQLAALSYRRRQAGKDDIHFDRADLAALNTKRDFNQVVAHNFDKLDAVEQAYLKQASAAKLIGAAAYRPFQLELDDCRQLAAELKDLSGLPSGERSIIRRDQAEVLRIYIDAGLWRQIAALNFPIAVFARLPKRYWWKLCKHLRSRRSSRKGRAA
jgi:glycosyltransferase involved in cell wall biosynthesis